MRIRLNVLTNKKLNVDTEVYGKTYDIKFKAFKNINYIIVVFIILYLNLILDTGTKLFYVYL